MPVRKAPMGKANAEENMNTTQKGMDGKYWHSKLNKGNKYQWFRGPAPDSAMFRKEMDPEIRKIMDIYYPTSVDSYEKYQKQCHLTSDLQCASGPGPGADFCKKNGNGQCRIDQDYKNAKQRRDARKDYHFQKQRDFQKYKYS